jgi:eukaryotic-like serine/threonine-protein kinase
MYGPGTQLAGRYRLKERIGAGGMGEVWRGIDEVLGRTVAVKVMLSALLDQPGFAERFRAEALTMANLNHPGVVDVYDYHSDTTTAFLVMEYVAGDPLSRTLHQVGRLTAARTLALVAQAADALQAAHDKGIVHRDVKPGNLLVRPDGTLVLTDFGIARSGAASQLTAAGTVLGTASYISPEQAAGQQATPVSDVYALGVVAYECLAGRRPFEGDNPLDIAMRHMREEPPPLPGDIPATVRDLVGRALAKEPTRRWPSAAHLAAAARQVAGGGTGGDVTAPLPEPSSGSAPPTPRTPSGAAGGFRRGAAVVGSGRGNGAPAAGPGRPAGGGAAAHPVTPPDPMVLPPIRPTPVRDRHSGVFVAAIVLAVLAVLLFAGLAGYVARQMVEGATLDELFPMIAYAQQIEGSMQI